MEINLKIFIRMMQCKIFLDTSIFAFAAFSSFFFFFSNKFVIYDVSLILSYLDTFGCDYYVCRSRREHAQS